MEYFRLDESGRLNDTQERLTSRGLGAADRNNDDSGNPFFFGGNPFQSCSDVPIGSELRPPAPERPFYNEAPSYLRPPVEDRRAPTRHYSPADRHGL
jgi:hypothetical protein